MTPGLAALLAGLFVIPALLLWAGHRMRRRSRRWRRTFWGALVGHIIAIPVASVASMYPAAEWDGGDVWRGTFGLWSLLVLPLIGAAVGAVRINRSRGRETSPAPIIGR